MARVRVYQLAKEIDISSKEMMDILLEIGMDIKSPSSTIEESVAETVKQIIEERRPKEPEPEPEPPAEPEPAPSPKPAVVVASERAPVAPIQEVRVDAAPRPTATTSLQSPTLEVWVPPAGSGPVTAPAGPVTEGKKKLTRKERISQTKRNTRREREAPTAAAPAPKTDEPAEVVAREPRTIKIPPNITIRDLAERSGIPSAQLLSKLLTSKILRSVNQSVASDVASQVLEGFNVSVEVDRRRVRMEELTEEEKKKLVPVAPVVTIMGHVDHGKTTLLDKVRNANVAASEAGQITQRIGAYEASIRGKKIVFLDTPGHEAFTMMRARGAHVTDIAILVVAADDGVMPQTQEAIDHARAAAVPIIVAINKIDRPEANVDRVKHQLSEVGLVPEEYGGDTIFMEVSAKMGLGIEELLEMILLVADMEDLRANPKGKAKGVVIESQLDPQRGPTATVLIQQGTLRLGDYVYAGACCGRVRAMYNHLGENLETAGPASAVSIIGFDSSPHASDILRVVADGKAARMKASEFERESRSGGLAGIQRVTLDDLFAQIQKGEIKDLNIVVKADVHGSVEALCQSLVGLEHDEVQVKIIHRGVGNVNDSDIMLASASNAIVIAFAVTVDAQAIIVAEREKIDVRTYDVIYDVINDVKAAMVGLLEPVYVEKLIGTAEVRNLFKSSRTGTIAGCMVIDGTVRRNTRVKVLREGQVVYEGNLDSLRHIREDASEISAGMECGISFGNYNDFHEGDLIQSYVLEEVPRTFSEPRSQERART